MTVNLQGRGAGHSHCRNPKYSRSK